MQTSDINLKKLAALIQDKTGIVYSDHNLYQLENRVKNLMTQLEIGEQSVFYAEVLTRGNYKILDQVLDLATNNETSFFRDPWMFDGIGSLILPSLIKSQQSAQIKIWSAACSTGQEPYSLVMQLEKERKKSALFTNHSLVCTDISDRVLKQAESGIYSSLEINRGISEPDKRAFFTDLEDGSWQIRSEFRRNLSFQTLNLLSVAGFPNLFDLVLCRNVLIYQTVENKMKIISEVAKKIRPGGFLILGGAESLFGLSDEFESIECNNAIFHQKKAG